jgi:aminoglycoside phosphotransferase (APT) family kinase protein
VTAERVQIDADLVRRLVAAQFPQWAGLPVTRVLPGGANNRTFRLGGAMLARLPRAAPYQEGCGESFDESARKLVDLVADKLCGNPLGVIHRPEA